MEATARMPGYPGSTQDGRSIGDHLHHLLSLATALAHAATATATTATTSAGSTDESGSSAAGSRFRQHPVTVPFGLELGALEDAEVVHWAQTLEHLDRFLTGLQVQVAGELSTRVRAGRYDADGIKAPVDLLTGALTLSRTESYRRIRLAEHFLPTTDPLTTATTPPAQPVLGAAFFTGNLSEEQALLICTHTEEAIHLAAAGRIPETTAWALEETLTGYAREETPDHLRRIALRALNLLDPDGQEPTPGELLTKQGIFFHQPRRGLVSFNGHMSIAQYEMTMAFIGSATNPNKHTNLNDINPNPDPDKGDDNKSTATTAPLPGQGDLLNLVTHIATNTPTTTPTTTATPDNNHDSQHRPGDPDRTATETTTAPDAGTTPRTSAAGATAPGFPPPQGPIPDWARDRADDPPLENPATHDNRDTLDTPDAHDDPGGGGIGWKPTIDRGGDWSFQNTPTPTTATTPPTPTSPGPGEAAGWPHLVNGISVPAPGSGEDLPGLDPIDPASTDPAVKDRRSHGQRLLDGLIDCLKLAARTNKLPSNGGLKPQLFISTTQADLTHTNTNTNTATSTGTGTGRSAGIALAPYSGPQPLSAFAAACCDADITHLFLDQHGSILNVGRTQRRFTTAQRKILIARDMGCTFPDCTAPPYWCDAHHILPWKDGGETSINNGALLCTFHHTLLHHGDWTLRLHHNTPLFTPSYRLDPTQRERHNNYHHGHPKN